VSKQIQKYQVMKKLFITCIAIAFLISTKALAAPVLVTQPSPGYGGRNGGGEFNISPNFTSGVYGPDVAIFGGFQTFCVEAQVDIVVPGNYNATLSSQDASGTPLTAGAAWLYQLFATEDPALAYNYTPGTGRTDASGELQQAIWILQGQGGPNVVETAATSVDVQLASAHFGSLANAQAPNNGTFPVSIVILTDANGAPVQNMLALTQASSCTNPDCTITPSVSIAIAGVSNYTASVADAGPGATYLWTISNGKITDGQGTSTITWTAGSETSNPVCMQIIITASGGCQSGCSACVKLTSPPPPSRFGAGDTATIGFWQNKNGQGLINNASNPPALADWLATTYPCLYGSLSLSNLTGKANSAIAARFVTLFKSTAPKTDAQIMCTALGCYFTSTALGGGSGPVKFGFNQSLGGTGVKTFNVGSNGTDLGLQVNGVYTISDILTAANNWRCSHPTTAWPTSVNNLFDSINQGGDI
jgi:hypothetical protein